jgi:hypothetical protein
MKPGNITINLSEADMKSILTEWAQREYPDQGGVLSIHVGAAERAERDDLRKRLHRMMVLSAVLACALALSIALSLA